MPNTANSAGSSPGQMPLNHRLGAMAYQDPAGVVIKPQPASSPAELGDMTFQLTNNTSLTVRVRGTDNVVRSVTLTLA